MLVPQFTAGIPARLYSTTRLSVCISSCLFLNSTISRVGWCRKLHRATGLMSLTTTITSSQLHLGDASGTSAGSFTSNAAHVSDILNQAASQFQLALYAECTLGCTLQQAPSFSVGGKLVKATVFRLGPGFFCQVSLMSRQCTHVAILCVLAPFGVEITAF
jgi:hypothetical protein